MGLFAGISLLTLVELLELMFFGGTLAARKRRKGREPPAPATAAAHAGNNGTEMMNVKIEARSRGDEDGRYDDEEDDSSSVKQTQPSGEVSLPATGVLKLRSQLSQASVLSVQSEV